MDIEKAREMMAAASPWPWKVRHRDIRGSEQDDEMGTGLGLELEGPPEPMLRGQFAKAADAQLAAGGPATLAALILAVEALEGHGLLLDCLETVCVGLPPADREAADNFIEQIAAANRNALAAWEKL